MGAGIGFSRSAQMSHKQNKELLAGRETYAGGRQSFPRQKHLLEFKESDKESMEQLHRKVLKEKRKDTMMIVGVIATIIAITFLVVFL